MIFFYAYLNQNYTKKLMFIINGQMKLKLKNLKTQSKILNKKVKEKMMKVMNSKKIILINDN